jgi:PAS domain S-box-containing protein
VREVGDAVIDRGVAFARADTCTLYALDEATMELELVAERGCDPLVVDKIRKIGPDADNPSYGVGTGGRDAVFIETADAYDAFFPSLARIPAPGARARSFWCVPLRAEGHTVGMLGVGFYEERRFDDDERDFVATFARQCAQALARARGLEAERRVAALAERLGASLSTTLRSIGDAVIATDATGRITLMNRVAESLTAVSEADARGRALPEVFRIVNEHTREVVQNPVEKVLESGGIVGLANHTVLLAHDGREISIDDSGAPIRPAGGAIEGVVLVFRDVTDRKREESHRTFLADATSALSESLDYETTVARVAHLAVPRLADWCAVDLAVDGERRPKRLAVAHVDPKKIQYAKTLDEKYPPDPDAKTGVPNVLRTGRAEIYREIPDELLVAGCVDEEHLRIARELKLHSAMVVPLVVRGRVLGAMTFVLAESGRRYDDDDLDLAGELAQRCANAIENARVYSSEQQAR